MSTIKSVELRESERLALHHLTNSLSRLCWVRARQVQAAEDEAEMHMHGERAIEASNEKLCERIEEISKANGLGTRFSPLEQLDRIAKRLEFFEEQLEQAGDSNAIEALEKPL
jgi:hypothetical protein